MLSSDSVLCKARLEVGVWGKGDWGEESAWNWKTGPRQQEVNFPGHTPRAQVGGNDRVNKFTVLRHIPSNPRTQPGSLKVHHLYLHPRANMRSPEPTTLLISAQCIIQTNNTMSWFKTRWGPDKCELLLNPASLTKPCHLSEPSSLSMKWDM